MKNQVVQLPPLLGIIPEAQSMMFVMLLIVFFIAVCFRLIKGMPPVNQKAPPRVIEALGRCIARRFEIVLEDPPTLYFLTFELDNGDRYEFRVVGSTYGLIVEGDQGRVRIQNGRLMAFQRIAP